MSEVLTFLLSEVRPASGADTLACDVVTAAGGTVLAAPRRDGGHGNTRSRHATTLAAFCVAGDAAAAALRLVERWRADAGSEPRPRPRIALCTGEANRRDAGPAVERVKALYELVGEDQILVTASSAVMIGHALPLDVALVDLGARRLAGHRPERIYELRPVHHHGRAPDDAGAANLGWARRAAAGEVVGRDDLVAALEERWHEALSDRRRLVVITGEAGVGKTTLVADVALRLHAAGAQVLYGRWDEDQVAPYQAVREALGIYAAACPTTLLRADLAGHLPQVARLLPDVGARLGGALAPPVGGPDAERLCLFEAIDAWLGEIARRRSLLVVLDDLQWADQASLALLHHVVEASDPPLLVVATMRHGQAEIATVESRADEVGTSGASSQGLGTLAESTADLIAVEGLAPVAVWRLVTDATRAGLAGDEAEIAGWLADETAGNPLFVQEVLRGLERVEDPAAALRAMRHRLFERLHDVIAWRLAALPPAHLDDLAVASVIGREFAVDVVATVAARAERVVRDRLGEAVRAGLVHEMSAVDGRLAFTHAVVRQALLDGLDADRAVRLHGRTADALASRAGDDATAAEIAHHYVHAGGHDPVAAVGWARRAAEQARRQTAFEAAADILAEAVDVHDRYGDDPVLSCELHLDLAEAHDRAGAFAARDQRYEEAAAIARPLGRTDLLARIALGYGGHLPASPPPNPAARALLEEVLVRLPHADSRTRALALAHLGHVLHLDAPHPERRALCDEAVSMARRLDVPSVLASALVSRSLALDGPDDAEDAIVAGDEVMQIGRRIGDLELILQGARVRIPALFTVGQIEAARALATTFTELAERSLHPEDMRLTTMGRIQRAALEGRFAEAEAQAEELREVLRRSRHPQRLMIYLAITFPMRWLRSDLDRVKTLIRAIRLKVPELCSEGRATAAMEAVADAFAGRSDDVRALVAGARLHDVSSVDHCYLWLPTVVSSAIAASAIGDAEWADAVYEVLHPYRGRHCVMGYAAYLGAMDHHLGTLAAAMGRADESVELLGAALDRHSELGARPFVALSARWLATVVCARDAPGDADRAHSLTEQSRALAAELGLGSLPHVGP